MLICHFLVSFLYIALLSPISLSSKSSSKSVSSGSTTNKKELKKEKALSEDEKKEKQKKWEKRIESIDKQLSFKRLTQKEADTLLARRERYGRKYRSYGGTIPPAPTPTIKEEEKENKETQEKISDATIKRLFEKLYELDKRLLRQAYTQDVVDGFVKKRNALIKKIKKSGSSRLIPDFPSVTIMDAATARQKYEKQLKQIDNQLKKGVAEAEAEKVLKMRKKVADYIIRQQGNPPPAPQPKIISNKKRIKQLLQNLEKIDDAIMEGGSEEKIDRLKKTRHSLGKEIISLGGKVPSLEEKEVLEEMQQSMSSEQPQDSNVMMMQPVGTTQQEQLVPNHLDSENTLDLEKESSTTEGSEEELEGLNMFEFEDPLSSEGSFDFTSDISTFPTTEEEVPSTDEEWSFSFDDPFSQEFSSYNEQEAISSSTTDFTSSAEGNESEHDTSWTSEWSFDEEIQEEPSEDTATSFSFNEQTTSEKIPSTLATTAESQEQSPDFQEVVTTEKKQAIALISEHTTAHHNDAGTPSFEYSNFNKPSDTNATEDDIFDLDLEWNDPLDDSFSSAPSASSFIPHGPAATLTSPLEQRPSAGTTPAYTNASDTHSSFIPPQPAPTHSAANRRVTPLGSSYNVPTTPVLSNNPLPSNFSSQIQPSGVYPSPPPFHPHKMYPTPQQKMQPSYGT